MNDDDAYSYLFIIFYNNVWNKIKLLQQSKHTYALHNMSAYRNNQQGLAESIYVGNR